MGRKSAPQALALDNPPHSQAQPSPNDNLQTAETTSSGLSPAVSTSSATSPRPSHFSRPLPPNSRASPTARAGPQSLAANEERLPPPIQSTLDPSKSPSSRQAVASPLRPPSSRHAPSDSVKHSRGLFSHFNRGSRSANDHHRSASRGHSHSLESTSLSASKHRAEQLQQYRSNGGTTSSNTLQTTTLSTNILEPPPVASPASARRDQPKSPALSTQSKSSLSDRQHPSGPQTASGNYYQTMSTTPKSRSGSPPARTAPVAQEALARDTIDPPGRNRSHDRVPSRDREHRGPSPSHRENGTFLSGLRNTGTRAAGMLISKGLFGKGPRVGNTFDKDHVPVVDDEHYLPKVLHLPLVEQARRTRISKRLEDARDKTEFWMPAFPWRAIDYLNYKGCEVEGLYRVPGSGPQIKRWQRRFDEEYDIDLFTQDDLYDINIIGSMLKAWLRELPDELFPKAAQERISRQCAGAEKVPQLLIDELSNLSPFKYYLLFAITCHLSLLLAHSDKNKMNFQNLCICFQPCMKIDAFCFKFLVCDWRDCWQGCKNEAQYIEEEYKMLDQPPPPGLIESQVPSNNEKRDPHPGVERQGSSSSIGSKPSQNGNVERQPGRLNRKRLQVSESNGSIGSKDSGTSNTLVASQEHERDPSKITTDLRTLSPIQPVSPMGFQ